MKRKVLSVLLCAGLAVSMLAGCGSDSSNANKKAESTGSDLEYVKDKGTLVVGVTDFEPMDYKDDNGEWVGFDADMAKAFAESIGVEAEFVEIDWDNKELELDGKSIDCVWNGMTLTDEVESSMECTDAYMNNAQVVVVPADKADKYQDEDSVKDLTFAVEAGSAGEEQVNRIGAQYTAVSSQADALMEVASGNSDAAAIDALMAAAMIGEGTGYADLDEDERLLGRRVRLPHPQARGQEEDQAAHEHHLQVGGRQGGDHLRPLDERRGGQRLQEGDRPEDLGRRS